MNKYLDFEGLMLLIRKFKSNFVEKEKNKGLSANDYTDEDKEKVAAIDGLKANHGNIEIYHHLGYYPRIEVLYWEYGLGTVPLEETPAGISWDGTAPETIPFKVLHPSSTKLEIKVPKRYMMTNPTMTKIEEGYFFQEDIKSMQVRIIE